MRAELARRIEEVRDTSIGERLQVNSAEAMAHYLRPVVSGLDGWAPPAESSPVAVVAVESQVDGETVTFDLADVAPGARPTASRRRPSRGIPAMSKPKRPKRNPPRNHPPPNRVPRRRGPEVRAGGRVPTSPWPSTSTWCGPWRRRTPGGRWTVRDGVTRRLAQTTVLRKRQRAFGDGPAPRRWLADRTMLFRETPLPA